MKENASIPVELNGQIILKIEMAIRASSAAISIPPKKERSRLVVEAYSASPPNTTVVVASANNTGLGPIVAR